LGNASRKAGGDDPTRFTDGEIKILCEECGGRCCFCIPYTHDLVDINGFLRSGDVTMLAETREERKRLQQELAFIAANWIQIPVVEAKRTATYDVPGWSTEDGNAHYYNCTQWDAATKKCLAYGTRPPNCRGFPFFDKGDPSDSSDYLGCLLVKEAKRRQRALIRSRRRALDKRINDAREGAASPCGSDA